MIPYVDLDLLSCASCVKVLSMLFACAIPFRSSYDFRIVVIIGALMMTHTKWMHKLDFPAIDWPIADFPQYKHHLLGNTEQNRREEARCLQQVISERKFIVKGW